MMRKHIDTVERCIGALGGAGKAAEFMRVGPSQVSNMLRDGKITSAHHMRVYFRLISEGYSVDTAQLFGVENDGALIVAADAPYGVAADAT